MARKTITLSIVLAIAVMLLLVGCVFAQESSSNQQPQPATTSEMKQCKEKCKDMDNKFNLLSTAVEEAVKSNDSIKMKETLEQVQATLADLKGQMSMCMDMKDNQAQAEHAGGMMCMDMKNTQDHTKHSEGMMCCATMQCCSSTSHKTKQLSKKASHSIHH